MSLKTYAEVVQRWGNMPSLDPQHWGYATLEGSVGLYAPYPRERQAGWVAPYVALIFEGKPIIVYRPGVWILGGDLNDPDAATTLFNTYTPFRITHDGRSYLGHPLPGYTSRYRSRPAGAWLGGHAAWFFGSDCCIKYERIPNAPTTH